MHNDNLDTRPHFGLRYNNHFPLLFLQHPTDPTPTNTTDLPLFFLFPLSLENGKPGIWHLALGLVKQLCGSALARALRRAQGRQTRAGLLYFLGRRDDTGRLIVVHGRSNPSYDAQYVG